jgi:hypothetical protein
LLTSILEALSNHAFCFYDIAYKWNFTASHNWLLPFSIRFLGVTSILENVSLLLLSDIPFYRYILFSHSSVDEYSVSTFWLLWIMWLYVFYVDFVLISLGHRHSSGISGSYANFMFGTLRKWQNCFPRDHTIPHSHTQTYHLIHNSISLKLHKSVMLLIIHYS